jgi:hypothetical protein
VSQGLNNEEGEFEMAAGKCKTKTIKSIKIKICRDSRGQFTRISAAGGTRKKSKKRKKTPAKLKCVSGTLGKYGKSCGCYTKGGGFTFKSPNVCKNKPRRRRRS